MISVYTARDQQGLLRFVGCTRELDRRSIEHAERGWTLDELAAVEDMRTARGLEQAFIYVARRQAAGSDCGMGPWGLGPFENDFAADWAYELETAVDFRGMRTAFSSVVEATGYLESHYGSVAVAAAEVVAAARQRSTSPLPDPITAWVAAHGSELNDADVTLALRAIDRVLAGDSELRELWAESDENGWSDTVEDLRRRLGSESRPRAAGSE